MRKKISFLCLLFLWSHLGWNHVVPTHVILVDKEKGELFVAQYAVPSYKILLHFPTTIGQARGEKDFEGDLKTPEGIYFFTQKLLPPALKPKFGTLAFYVNYPNPIDKFIGRTGYDILLHGTNDPERLSRSRDSEGCVVVRNDILKKLLSFIRIRKTPFLIFKHIDKGYLKPEADVKLVNFFHHWVQAWKEKDEKRYFQSYHPLFKSNGKDLKAWKAYKSILNKKYAKIDVQVKNVQFFRHPHYQLIRFQQFYTSYVKNGKKAHVSKGTKLLYLAEENHQYKILFEDFSPQL